MNDERESNRFAPPKADVSPLAPTAAEFEPAGRGRRVLNFLLDYVAYMVFAMLVGVVLGVMGVGQLLFDSGKAGELLFGVVVILVYYLLTEGLTGRSFGKLLTRTYVVTASGGRPAFRQIVGRTLMRCVPFEFLSVLRENALMWHDSASGTRVVVRRAPG